MVRGCCLSSSVGARLDCFCCDIFPVSMWSTRQKRVMCCTENGNGTKKQAWKYSVPFIPCFLMWNSSESAHEKRGYIIMRTLRLYTKHWAANFFSSPAFPNKRIIACGVKRKPCYIIFHFNLDTLTVIYRVGTRHWLARYIDAMVKSTLCQKNPEFIWQQKNRTVSRYHTMASSKRQPIHILPVSYTYMTLSQATQFFPSGPFHWSETVFSLSHC